MARTGKPTRGIVPNPTRSRCGVTPTSNRLAARNYSENTLESRVDALKVFLSWAAERELSQAAQITRPMLEAYQRWLSKYTKADGKRLGWSAQQARLSAIERLVPVADQARRDHA